MNFALNENSGVFEVFGNAEIIAKQLPVALTIGNFDGVHRGHQFLFEELKARARALNIASCAVTFSPHPTAVFSPEIRTPLILSLQERVRRILARGIDVVVVQRFDAKFADMSSDEFCSEFLEKKFALKSVLLGYDFSYGRKRAGTFQHMRAYSQSRGWSVDLCEPFVEAGQIVSSTTIRHALQDRKVELAERMLGYSFFVSGVIVQGDQRGRVLGFPTANLESANEVVPGSGVYLCWVILAGEEERPYPAVMNCGYRPTVGERLHFAMEAHILNFTREIYGVKCEFRLHSFLRHEQKFSGLDELKTQIGIDVEQARLRFFNPNTQH